MSGISLPAPFLYNMKLFILYILGLIIFTGCQDNLPVRGAYPQEGLASWYVSAHTATGERYDADSLTCAMRKRDFGKYYMVCNPRNNKCVVVRHNNFGPSRKKFKEGRIIDLSKAAFSSIADLDEGLVRVTVRQE